MKQVNLIAALLLLSVSAIAQTVTPDPGPYTPMNQKYQYRALKVTEGLWNTGKLVQADSAQFSGVTYVPTVNNSDSTTKAANTAWVKRFYAINNLFNWNFTGNFTPTDPTTGRLGFKDSTPLHVITNDVIRLTVPENGITRSAAAANKILLIDTITKRLFYGDASGGADTTGIGNLFIRNIATPQENKSFNVKAGHLDSLYASTSGGGKVVSNGGTIAAEWGAGGGSNFDFHGFAGYNANRAASYTARSFTDKNYVDSSIAAGGGGGGGGGNWHLNGNASAVTNFLGTTNNRTMRFRTNNVERMVIDSIGRLGIGANPLTNSYFFSPSSNTTRIAGGANNALVSLQLTENETLFPGGFGSYFDYNGATDVASLGFISSSTKSERLSWGSGSGTQSTGPISITASGASRNAFLTYATTTGLGSGSENQADLALFTFSGRPMFFGNGTNGTNTNSTNAMAFFSGAKNFVLGGTSDIASAKLQVTSTTQGLLIPRMTLTQRNAIASPAAGLQVYNTTTASVDQFNGTDWLTMGLGGTAIVSNTAIGYRPLASNTTGARNTAVGYDALFGNATGSDITAIGRYAGRLNTGSSVTAIGGDAVGGNTASSGAFNTGVGYQSIKGGTGSQNTAVGALSLFSNTTGSDNVAFGMQALNTNVSGGRNAAVGYQSLFNTTASNNTAIGHRSAFDLSSGSFNITIGSYINPPSITTSGQLNIGNVLYGVNLYQTTSMSSTPTATGAISIGVTAPAASAVLEIASTSKGVLFPRMTTVQKLAIGSPAAGLQVYDTTLNQMSYFNGTTWVNF